MLLGVAGLLLSTMLAAQTIYIWTDEQGIEHFSDRPPGQPQADLKVQRARAEPADIVEVRQSGASNDPVWWFRNRLHGPVTLRVALEEASNVVSAPALPAMFELGPLEERELVTLGPLDLQQSWSYRFRTESQPGSRAARHAPSQPYRPPVAAGSRFRIGQAFEGAFSHDEPSSRHAVDIPMPTGTPVHAARGGIVMDMARYFHGSGLRLEYDGPRANYVRILHDDGSMGLYAHLDYEGVEVRLGQRVQRGQRIGRSGNTGYSTGPHLHFVVQLNRNLELISVPFEFEGPEGQGFRPSQGQQLIVVDPNRRP